MLLSNTLRHHVFCHSRSSPATSSVGLADGARLHEALEVDRAQDTGQELVRQGFDACSDLADCVGLIIGLIIGGLDCLALRDAGTVLQSIGVRGPHL